MYHGVINVYKEAGYTSHDVVARLRGILKQKKIGHTGTLDPAAQGVLPVCLGQATRLCDMLTDKSKTYEAVMLLGTVTDTQGYHRNGSGDPSGYGFRGRSPKGSGKLYRGLQPGSAYVFRFKGRRQKAV